MSFGTYPELSLRDARAMRVEARAMIAKGINPRLARKQKQQAARLAGEYTFMWVYEKWLAYRMLVLEEGRQSTLQQIRRVFQKDVIPALRRMTIHEITQHHLLEVIGRIVRIGNCNDLRRLPMFAFFQGGCPELHSRRNRARKYWTGFLRRHGERRTCRSHKPCS